MAKLKIGDIIEIKTQKGFAYAQYTHKHEQYGALIRVFGNLYGTRPHELQEFIEGHPSFLCFFPLGPAVHRGMVSIIDNAGVPLAAQIFPVFRAGVIDPSTGKVGVWWLWDGENEWRAGQLTAEQRKFPMRGIWNYHLLIERIESGWTSESDPA